MKKHIKVLIIEDNPADVELFRNSLPKMHNINLAIANDGEEGLKKALRFLPDLIVLDLCLPKKSGEEVCKSIRGSKNKQISEIPIIVVSAKSSATDRIVSKVIGATSYIVKPYEPSLMLKEIAKHIPSRALGYNKTERILVIEDNEGDAALIKHMLSSDKNYSYNTMFATTLREGFRALRKFKPDLILLDLTLPDSQALDTFQNLRSRVHGIPFLILTGRDDELLEEKMVQNGAQDYIAKMGLNHELLSRAIRHAINRDKFLQEIRHLSLTDDLTGLNNSRGFHALAQHQLKISSRKKEEFFMAFIDLDNLKSINDTFGHQEGNRAIKDVAAILNKTFRSSDIIGRVGGDEFAVAVLNCQRKEITTAIRRLGHNTKAFNSNNDLPYPLELSVGTAKKDPFEPLDVSLLLRRADQAMYKEKLIKKSQKDISSPS